MYSQSDDVKGEAVEELIVYFFLVELTVVEP